MNKIQKIGHRGAKGYAAENTLNSFQKALDLGVDGIELDVHLSADGQVMVIHDETIDRTTTKKGLVNDYTSSQLHLLGIPTLTQVFELVHQQCFINVEIKDSKAAKPVVEWIENYIANHNWKPDLFLISSFNWIVLEEIKHLNPSLRLGVLTEENIFSAIEFAQKIKAFSIHPYYQLLNEEMVSAIRKSKFKIYTWTVNSEEAITFVKKWEVDGIISDFPDKI